VKCWNLREIDAPAGTRDPTVLFSEDAGRAVMIALSPGQELGDHQVKERAWVVVVDGSIAVAADGDAKDCGVGSLVTFAPDERHSIRSEGGARILMLLAPWPGEGHFRGETQSAR
jgi:quercetin dioxygenase-like cupin family protein